jgi:predicted PurR-regulated permease PerM
MTDGVGGEVLPVGLIYLGLILTFALMVILLAWTLVYQQAENYWLSPKLSARTMSIDGGVAFGAALAGGAIAGPMGAFMALPVAALVTSIITNSGRKYDVVFTSTYASPDTPYGVA